MFTAKGQAQIFTLLNLVMSELVLSFFSLYNCKMIVINSSLIKTSPILKLFRLYKIVIILESFPNSFRRWGSVRPTICDQAQVDWTLRSGVRAQNDGKFELFVMTSALT